MTTHDQDTYTQPAESTSRTEQPLPSETPHRQVQSDWSDGQGLSPDQAQAVPTQTQATVRDSAVVSSEPAEQSVRKPIESSTERELFADDELAGLRARWDTVQATFVDDPRDCVQKADGLVSDVVQQLTAGFSDARARLEEQWARGEEASTEDLRVALKQYREFFQRLLAV